MSGKVAKMLRRESRHHPKDQRQYVRHRSGIIELNPSHGLSDRRILYRELNRQWMLGEFES